MTSRSLLHRRLAYIALLAVAVAFGILFPYSNTNDGRPRTFEVASWNMHWFPAGYREPQEPDIEARRINATANLMRKRGIPDILFAQEIRDMATCQALAIRLDSRGFQPVVCSAFVDYSSQEPTHQQLAIFSRFPAIEAGWEAWHAADFIYPPRGYAYAIFDIGGIRVACFNVHLKSNYIPDGQDVVQQTTLNRLKRELSIQQLLNKVEQFRAHGVTSILIAGDFNTSPSEVRFADEQTIQSLLTVGFHNAHDGLEGEEYATLPASQYYPATTFDYLFFRDLIPESNARVLPAVWVSDHREIRASFSTLSAP